jgi:demethylmenaquinone methyltransferase/2-methoxy-6-polyprenyl-1,4-benzoquinol methylase
VTRADLNKEPDDVSRMFDRVARRYDLLNDLLSLGQTKRWRNSVTKLISPKPGMKILDIAAGTGASSAPLAKAGADVTALDFSEGMLEEGRRLRPEITFIHGDALTLGFANSTFDVTTISFGLRNTHDISKALSEALRVTKENGLIYVVEFSHPTSRIFRSIYLKYLMRLLPRVARIFTQNPEAYDYLAESIIAWPNQADLAEIMAKSGWREVRWENLTFGVVAVHTARK